METNCLMPGSARRRREPSGWRALGIALISLAVGWFVTAKLMGPKQVSADGDRVFELRVYHVVPGKVLELESRFRPRQALIALGPLLRGVEPAKYSRIRRRDLV